MKKDKYGFLTGNSGNEGILLTIIECDKCHESLGTCRQLKFMPNKSVKYIYCDECGDEMNNTVKLMEKELKELRTLVRLIEATLRNVDRIEGG